MPGPPPPHLFSGCVGFRGVRRGAFRLLLNLEEAGESQARADLESSSPARTRKEKISSLAHASPESLVLLLPSDFLASSS